MLTIDQLWLRMPPHPKVRKEAALAERFARQRAVYLQEAVKPPWMPCACWTTQIPSAWPTRRNNLYERASLDIRALTDLQFQLAHATYEAGVRSHA